MAHPINATLSSSTNANLVPKKSHSPQETSSKVTRTTDVRVTPNRTNNDKKKYRLGQPEGERNAATAQVRFNFGRRYNGVCLSE